MKQTPSNQDEIDKLLERQKSPKLTQAETETLNSPVAEKKYTCNLKPPKENFKHRKHHQ